MKSFADWTQEIAERGNHEPEPDCRYAVLPDCVIWYGGDDYQIQCCICGTWRPLEIDPGELTMDYRHHCGGSPRCCP